MLNYFKGSFFITILEIIFAYFWGEHLSHGNGFMTLFVVIFLAILEVTLSFDNAVINAIKLEKMSDRWRHRFLTWGIIIAVFGMRFLFPIIIVAAFSGLTVAAVTNLALYDVDKYTYYLHIVHAPLVTFGGAFLLMIFLAYFFHEEKEINWITFIEKPMLKLNCVKYVDVVFSLLALIILQHFIPVEQKVSVMMAGYTGIILYLVVDSISNLLEQSAEKKAAIMQNCAGAGFVGFLYLELIDASFSLDGVLGAFAISKDIIIICIGLAIGAMFVRSLTIYMVEMKTLKQFLYLEHGAHWAIGFLSVIMFISTRVEVSEVITGGTGLVIVGAAFISSVIYNKKCKSKKEEIIQNVPE
ncbi:MAG: DUF475 domain-containing protein [Candidatus Gastranaerophilales bacterium]|nr:DUF475 domain-containing protein [Candidatus Gastranaerophilales bacterium]